MKKNYLLLGLLACAAFFNAAFAQCTLTISASADTVCLHDTAILTAQVGAATGTLSTTFAAGNNHRGNMFNITATNTVIITSFDAHPMTNTTIAIYYRAGSYSGFESNPGAWTLAGSAAVTAQPQGTPTPVPVLVNVTIPAGQTYGFYVTSTSTSVSLNYTDGNSEGAIYASDANIAFHQGVGLEYPFTGGSGTLYTPRVWNGVIHYTTPQAISYQWSTGETTNTITATPLASTTYNLSVTVTGSGCGTLTANQLITVDVPTVNAGADTTICSGQAYTFNATGAQSYAWSNGNPNGGTFIFNTDTTLSVAGTDLFGCRAYDTVIVSTNPLPPVNAGADTAVCMGSTATLAGSGAVSYSWTGGITNNVPFAVSAPGSYEVTGTDVNGCTATDEVMIFVSTPPTLYAGADTTVCYGSAINLTAMFSSDSLGADSLVTTYSSNNNHRGTMFNVSALNDIVIDSLSLNMDGSANVLVYYRTSPYAGFETDTTGWIFVDSAAVTAQPINTPSALPLNLGIAIPAGQTYALYLTSSNTAVSLLYTNGTNEGAPYAGNMDLIVREGVGLEYPFGANTGQLFRPRVWNGTVHYTAQRNTSATYLWNTLETTKTITPTITTDSTFIVTAAAAGCLPVADTVNIQVSVATVAAGNDTAVCAGNSALLTATGADLYAWNNSVSNGVAFVPAGTDNYIVTGTNSLGCTATDTVIVMVNALPLIDAGADTAICAGDSILLMATGGSTYTWLPNAANGDIVAPGNTITYSVTGTDNAGCVNGNDITITVNMPPMVNAGTDTAVCAGNMLTLQATGADTLTWNNGVVNNVAFAPAVSGPYTVTGTDASGCSATDTLQITVNTTPPVNAGADTAICAGNSLVLTGNGASTYTWSNGVINGAAFTPAATGNYNVTGTDANGCAGFDTVSVTVNTVNTAVTVQTNTVTAAAAGAGYQWINCSNSAAINGATAQSYTATADGSYAVVVTQNGCVDTSACQTIDVLGITNISGNLFKVYPNPTQSQLVINTGNLIADGIVVSDINGHIVEQVTATSSQTVIDMANYAAGMYLVRISAQGSTQTTRVVKQ